MNLTEKQNEIVRRIAVGDSLKCIAEDFNLSDKTVSSHLAKAREKIGAHSRAELIHYGIARLGVPLMFALLLLALPARSADVTLGWDVPVIFPAITNFAIYTSTQPITNAATVLRTNTVTGTNALTISNLTWTTTFNFVAVTRQGTNESDFSNPAIYTTPKLPAPNNLRIGP